MYIIEPFAAEHTSSKRMPCRNSCSGLPARLPEVQKLHTSYPVLTPTHVD